MVNCYPSFAPIRFYFTFESDIIIYTEEVSPEIPKSKQIPRRQFLKRAGKIAAIAAAYGIFNKFNFQSETNPDQKTDETLPSTSPSLKKPSENSPKNISPSGSKPDETTPKNAETKNQFSAAPPEPLPPGLPKDTISPEQLQSQRIRVIQTEKVKLYLREKISEFQLFNDAKKGKINEAVIVLVDVPYLSWNMNNEIPEEARQIFQAAYPYSEENKDTGLAAGTVINTNHLLSNDFINGNFEQSQRARSLLETHPEIKNKIYVYIAVGGDLKPNPSQSLPKHDNRPEKTFKAHTGGTYLDTPLHGHQGFLLRHELIHYKNPNEFNTDELNVDRAALISLVAAWNHYYPNKDNSKFPFVFVTDEGITITKNQNAKTDSTS